MRRKKRSANCSRGKWVLFLSVLCLLIPVDAARAELLSITFSDPFGDHTGEIDVIGMEILFDNATGSYTITLTASAAHPFQGEFRVNLALFNPDTGATTQDPSFVQDDLNEFSLANSSRTITLKGANARFVAWQVGHRVATSNGPFGLPSDAEFFSFNSHLAEVPFVAGKLDRIAFNEYATIQVADISSTPAVTGLHPNSALAGNPGLNLKVVGRNFLPDSKVRWNGVERFTVFNSSKQLRAIIPASEITTPGSAQVEVYNPGYISNTVEFAISTPSPLLCCLSPISAVSDGPDFTIEAYGDNFVPGSTLLWNGSPRPTVFHGGRHLQATIAQADIASPGSAVISISNSAGATSNPRGFPVIEIPAGSPTITSVDPAVYPAGGAEFELTVLGQGFLPQSTIRFNDQDRSTTYVSPTQLKAVIPASDVALAQTFGVTVVNPESNAPSLMESAEPSSGLSSNAGVVVVTNPVPVVLKISPTFSRAGGPEFDVTVTGLNFVTASRVRWNGGDRDTEYMNSTQLRATIRSSDIATEGAGSLSVSNPGPGGGISNSFVFSIQSKAELPNSLIYPRLVSSIGNAADLDTTENTGIAIANLGGADATLIFSAYDRQGMLITGPDVVNPAHIEVGSTEQIPITDSQIFGAGLQPQSPIGWIRLESSIENVVGFFLSFNDSLTILDGADVSSNSSTQFLLPEIEDQGFTEVHVVNPGSAAAAVTFELRTSQGTLRTTPAVRSIPPSGTLAALATESPEDSMVPSAALDVLFPGVIPVGSDYIWATADQPAVSFEYLGKTGRYVEGLNGQDGAGGAATLYSPQYVVGGGSFRTTLSIINLEVTPGTVTFRFISDDGSQIGCTQYRLIDPKGKLYIDEQDFFLPTPDALTQGYVEIMSDGPRLAGSVVFGDPERSRFSSALPLISTLHEAVVFGQIASNSVYFTGIAIINPNEDSASAAIEVLDRNGKVVRSKTELIPARQRKSLLLTQYFPDLVNENISSGYIKVTVSEGVASFSLFGTNDLSVLSSVPPQLEPLRHIGSGAQDSKNHPNR